MNIQPKCNPPVVWKAVCKVCAKELCRFCSKPHDEWKTKPLENYQFAHKSGSFSAFVSNYVNMNMAKDDFGLKRPEQPCCADIDNFEIISTKYTNHDMAMASYQLMDTCNKVFQATRAVGQLKKLIGACKISPESYTTMYNHMDGVRKATEALTEEKLGIPYFLKDVTDDVNF